MASDVKVFTGVEWVSLKGEKGDPGASGPTVVSSDAGNLATLGTDGRIFVSQSATDTRYVAKAGDTMTGALYVQRTTAPTLPDGSVVAIGDGMAASCSVQVYSDTANAAPVMAFSRARGSKAAPTETKAGDSTGTFSYRSMLPGGTWGPGAFMRAKQRADAAPGDTFPSMIFEFGTAPGGTTGSVTNVSMLTDRVDGASQTRVGIGTNFSAPTRTLDVSGDAIISGAVSLGGNAYPTTPGTAGQVLATDGAGVLSWADAGAAGNVFRTILAEDEAGTKGERCWDANWEYRCIDTNTWRRWRRFTWDESDPSSGVSVGSGTGSAWRVGSYASTPGHIIFANGRFVGIRAGAATPMFWSNDGLTWTTGTGVSVASHQTSVAYNGGTFLTLYGTTATNGQTYPFTSADGKAWTARGQITSLAYSNPFAGASHGFFHGFAVTLNAASSANVICRRSTDGLTWSASTVSGLTTDTLSQVRGLATDGSVAVAVGFKGITSTPTATNAGLRTTDGITWSKVTMPNILYMGVCYGASKFVAVGTGNLAAYSADGTTWQTASMPATADWSAITYGAGHFVAVAKGTTTAARSPDGITWEAITLPELFNWSGLAYGMGRFIAVSNHATNTQKIAVSE